MQIHICHKDAGDWSFSSNFWRESVAGRVYLFPYGSAGEQGTKHSETSFQRKENNTQVQAKVTHIWGNNWKEKMKEWRKENLPTALLFFPPLSSPLVPLLWSLNQTQVKTQTGTRTGQTQPYSYSYSTVLRLLIIPHCHHFTQPAQVLKCFCFPLISPAEWLRSVQCLQLIKNFAALI